MVSDSVELGDVLTISLRSLISAMKQIYNEKKNLGA